VRAFDLLKDRTVDLLFLDIQMPVLNGLDFVKSLRHPPAVIITTAYREYALDGYDLDIIDYLLKPIVFDRFLKAVDRYRARTETPVSVPVASAPEAVEYLFFNVNRMRHKVVLRDVLFLESLKDYVRIHLREERLVVKGNLGSVLKMFPAGQLLRIHRSYAIAPGHLEAYNQRQVEVGGQQLPIGTSYQAEIGKRLG
ncbi:MAG: LytTR family DNA-binding domain-containing protein, partial [Bacteroidota bacterium]